MDQADSSIGSTYWPHGFRAAAEHLQKQPGARGLWVRFLGKGIEHYLDDHRDVIVAQLAASLVRPAERSLWRAAFSGEPRLREHIVSLLEQGDPHAKPPRVDLRGQARASVEELASGAGEPSVAPSVQGHARVIVHVPYAPLFSVEDIVVMTCPRSRRAEYWQARVRAYANSTAIVDHCLERLHPELYLAEDDEEPHVVGHLCMPAHPSAIGSERTQQEGRSLDLGALIAALSYRYKWRLSDDRVVATGRVEVEPVGGSLCSIRRVESVPEKLDAVIRWASDLTVMPGGRRGVVLLPRDNERDAAAAAPKLEALGVEVRFVQTLEDVLRALPFQRADGEPTLRAVDFGAAAMIFVWYAERLLLGEFFGDPTLARIHSLPKYALISIGPALLPASTLLAAPFLARTAQRVGSGLAWIVAALFISSQAMYLIQLALGGLTLHNEASSSSPLIYSEQGIRRVFIWKDIGAVYPLLAATLVLIPLQAHRARFLARADRERGRVLDEAWFDRRVWARYPAWTPWLLVALIVLALLAHLWFFRDDFIWYLRHKNAFMAAHIGFQIIWSVLIGLFMVHALFKAERRAAGATARRWSGAGEGGPA